MININEIPSPCYVMEEALLRKNLEKIKFVKDNAGVEIILALKAFAMWKAFPIISEYIPYATASSINEAQLVLEQMGTLAHTYSPAYTENNFLDFTRCSSHITFNSLSQFQHFYPKTLTSKHKISCGLRINPEFSLVDTDLYNPCAPGSRLGIDPRTLPNELPEGVEGLHFHTLCESSSYDLEQTLQVVEERFNKQLNQVKWLNMGGGHLITREDYDSDHLINLLKSFKARYPHLKIILEPGSAFTWQTGFLRTTIVDIVENKGIKTAIMDASFACHMPDCLEMPYQPEVRRAQKGSNGKHVYRIGGSSCLSGDFIGDWSFNEPLSIGDPLLFEDMIHYTIVKTTMFNGISHPSLAFWTTDNKLKIIHSFTYEDYKNRMS